VKSLRKELYICLFQLCSCDDCKKTYSEKDLEFLLDPEDTVHFYESTGLSEGKLLALAYFSRHIFYIANI
jgi:hypothetical protein